MIFSAKVGDPNPAGSRRKREDCAILRRFRALPAAATILTLGLTALAAVSANTGHRREIEARHQVAAERIEQRIANHVLALQAVKGALVAQRGLPSRAFFRDMVAALPREGGIAGVRGIGIGMAQRPEDPASASRIIREGYRIDRQPFPDTTNTKRYTIVMLEPADATNRNALGFDMYAEARRKQAMDNAARTGLPASISAILLVQDADQPQPGVLIYVPVYVSEGVTTPGASADGDVAAYVYAAVRVSELVRQVLSEEPALPLSAEIYASSVAPENLLFKPDRPLQSPSAFTIRAADQKWIVRVGGFDPRARLNPAWIIALIGLVLSGALGALVNEHLAKVEATETLAQRTTQLAEQRELLLGEMQHRLKNAIARMLALFRLTARETKGPDLVPTFEARLQAMARAQSLVVATPTGSQPLHAVVGAEMRQWAGGLDKHVIAGPEIMLEPGQVQAIGLILHELATNSLKYGALSASRPVDISWREVGYPDDSVEVRQPGIELRWHEDLTHSVDPPNAKTSASEQPPRGQAGTGPAQGFGSRFLRLMVEGQLGGRYERTLTPSELTMLIRFPRAAIQSASGGTV